MTTLLEEPAKVEAAEPLAIPGRLALATDLGPRCDRALDRARQLARQWRARLFAVHAIEPGEADGRRSTAPGGSAPPASVGRRLRRNLGEAVDDIEVFVAEGKCEEVVSEIARSREAGLVITGVARDEVLGRRQLGRSVAALVHEARLPLLIVRDRMHDAYRRIVVATDFSDGSAIPLLTAASWFPTSPLTLLHAYDPPFAGMATDRTAYEAEYRAVAAKEAEAFLATTPLPRDRLELVLEPGSVTSVLTAHVEARDVDLVVIGSGEKSLLHRLLAGSTDTSILAEVPCDILVVPKIPAGLPAA
ncbi:universal stress protein [Ancylobacter oerskovii]|uniref:Universal stress protein n=1 Tax=Ancylobacter oerskovii TaxID=459519 RepID=A0ABW4YVR9_9HYPH|nr:universal stress protein [Ancylobacter oerskovii]MBS7543133.1 universal stress protein [Ancylobacter oerskovii]